MTTLREAAQQALEALEDHAKQYPHMQKGYTVDAITALRTALAEQAEQEPVEIEMPEYHSHGMGCGLEDRGITDRYQAMEYGWYEAIDRVKEELANFGPLYTAPQPAIPPGYKLVPIQKLTANTDDKHDEWRFGDGEDSTSGPKDCAVAIRQLKDKT